MFNRKNGGEFFQIDELIIETFEVSEPTDLSLELFSLWGYLVFRRKKR